MYMSSAAFFRKVFRWWIFYIRSKQEKSISLFLWLLPHFSSIASSATSVSLTDVSFYGLCSIYVIPLPSGCIYRHRIVGIHRPTFSIRAHIQVQHSEGRVDEMRKVILPYSVWRKINKAIPCDVHRPHFILNFIQFVSRLRILFLILFEAFNVRLCGLRGWGNCTAVPISWWLDYQTTWVMHYSPPCCYISSAASLL